MIRLASSMMLVLSILWLSQPIEAAQARGVPPLALIKMIDARTGWAMTSSCTSCRPSVRLVLRTTNAGRQWRDVTPLGPSRDRVYVRWLYAFDARNAWVVGSRGSDEELFRTRDGGRTWKRISYPNLSVTYLVVTSIAFINHQEGWLLLGGAGAAGSEEAEVHHSRDGGDSWISVARTLSGTKDGLPFGGGKSGMTFLSRATGWITGTIVSWDVYVYVTRDGGRTWHHQALPVPPQPQRKQPLHPNITARWDAIASSPPRFFTAKDGILRVYYQNTVSDKDTGDFEDTGHLIAFYVTRDAGATWSLRSLPVSLADLQSQPSTFSDIRHGWVKDGDRLYATVNGGQTWQTVFRSSLLLDVTQIDFISEEVGWAVRNGDPFGDTAGQTPPFLLKTENGGRTWAAVAYTIIGR